MVCSDWHAGKKTDTYDSSVFESRVRVIPGKLATHPCLPKDPDEIALLFVGDIVDGSEIYPTQAYAQDAEAPEQIALARRTVWQMALRLLVAYPAAKISLAFVPGNHGRWSKTASPSNNLDLWLGHDIQELSDREGCDRISVQVSRGNFLPVSVGGTRGVITHRGVKHTGTPSGQRKFAAWCKHWGALWVAGGHWHHACSENYEAEWYFHGGALGGVDDLSEEMACFDPARQLAFVVDGGKIAGTAMLEW